MLYYACKRFAEGELITTMVDRDILLSLNEVESAMLRLAKPYLQVRDNERHTLNAIEFNLKLLENYEADRAIVIPAMILHDVGWSAVTRDVISKACRTRPDKELVRIHEEEGLKIAGRILKDIGYDPSRIEKIMDIIDGHDTRGYPLSVNDKIVKDSDKLTRYAKNFWFWTDALPMAPEELTDILEGLIDNWFFLEKSKDMAKAEISQRRIEERESLQ
jgi:HD superfamily phosphodiesterase